MWRPIDSESTLPPIGALESPWLEFKAHGPDDQFEAAKDVVALANAAGGSMIVGAVGGQRLVEFRPIAREEAQAAIRLYEEAIRDRCRPPPVVAFTTLPIREGFVLVVNVHPFPGQVVGVRIKKHETKCGASAKELQDLYYFPVRVATHTRGITPEQVPMFVDARIRRVAISLQQAVGQEAILFATKTRDGKSAWMSSAKIVDVDVLGNVATFRLPYRETGVVVPVPMDAVGSVCRAPDCWHIYLSGTIAPVSLLAPQAGPLGNLTARFDFLE